MIRVARRLLLLPIAFLLIADISAQVDFCAVGDVLLDRGVRKVIEQNDVNYPFEDIDEIINKNDLALFNLECPLSHAEDGFPINKRYSFRADPEYAKGLKFAGFNIATIANNHTIDYGKSGFLKTMEVLEEHSIYSIGGGEDQNLAFQPLLVEKKGEAFAFFGHLEFLLEGTTFNKDQPYPAFGQIDRLCSDIQKLNSHIDHIIVTFHWGQENVAIPTKRQISYAHKVIDAGADLVIGHHPHILQSIATYKNKLILYSLGNFVFDNSDKLQKQSVIFRCQFENGKLVNPELVPVYINNCRPELASSQNTREIFEHLNRVSQPFQTTLSLNDSIIKINYNVEYPIRELNASGRNFYIFKKKIVTYNALNEATEYT
jgi:poly-gamma-glutamate synthesis protein (capsule biosynthesis protein)